MATVRMQVIQRFLLDKKPEEPPAPNDSTLQVLSKIIESSKFTPILASKSVNSRTLNRSVCKPSETKKSSSREVSPLNPSVFLRLSVTQSSMNFFRRTPKPQLSNSSSLDLIRPNKVILQKKIKEKVANRGGISPKKSVRVEAQREVKSVEIRVATKGDIDRLWRRVICASNGFETYPAPFFTYYAHVGKGNNSPLIKKLITARSWWKLTETMDSAHFVWCQWKNKKLLESLKLSQSIACIKEDQTLPPWPTVSKILLPKTKLPDLEYFGLNHIIKSSSYILLNPEKHSSETQKLHNHLESNQILTNKKGLYQTMRTFYEVTGKELFDKLPVTFHISSESDPEFSNFLSYFSELESKKSSDFHNIWILKPGENTNRGNGITVCNTLDSIIQFIKPVENKTYILQKYIENPLLINKRKFDIRCYTLVTSINGVIQGYFYLDGYLRTTSQEFLLEDVSNLYIHLTNDAIQKHSADYGKFENGNKKSYREFQRYLDQNFPDTNFFSTILPKIKEIVKETLLASFMYIDPNKRMHSMEILGYDFMIDSDFKPWLIEVNTNPCLELSSPYLRAIIPAMVENAFKIVLDSMFPPPAGHVQEIVQMNRFELIFHQDRDGKKLITSLEQ